MSVRAKVVKSFLALPTASMGHFSTWDRFALSLGLHFSSNGLGWDCQFLHSAKIMAFVSIWECLES
eukprot:464753-Pyramimonas_sp.AAC.1